MYFCFTPYVGAGIGVASISVLGLKDVNVPNGGVATPPITPRRTLLGPPMAVSPTT